MSTASNNRVVLEIGSANIKGGVAGRHTPHFVLPTPLALQDDPRRSAPSRRAYLETLTRLFIDHLQLRPKDCQVIIVEKLTCSRAHRTLLLDVLLRDLHVSAVTMQIDACMAILASSSITTTSSSSSQVTATLQQPGLSGLVIDIGQRETRILAIAQGRPVLASLRIVPLGLAHALKVFQSHLFALLNIHRTLQKNEAAAIKSLFERSSFAWHASWPGKLGDLQVAAGGGVSPEPFVLPAALRCDPLLVLVRGEVHSPSSSSSSASSSGGDKMVEVVHLDGLAGALAETLSLLSHDSRKSILDNILFTGGGGAVPGLGHAICSRASEIILERSRYEGLRRGLESQALRSETETDDAKVFGLSPAACAFPPYMLAFVGASLFGRLGDARYSSKYVTLKDVMVEESQGSGEEGRAAIRAPDWMSLSDHDWTFVKPVLRQ